MRRPRSWSTTDEFYEQITDEASKQGMSVSSLVTNALREYLSRQDAPASSFETTAEDDDFYMVKKFFTYSEDKRGHSSQVRVTLPKNLVGQLSRICKSGQIPELRTINDAIRNATFHFSRQLALWIDDGDLKSEIDLQMMIADEEMIAQKKADAEGYIAVVRKNLEDAFARQDYAFIKPYLDSRRDRASVIPEAHRPAFEDMLNRFDQKWDSEMANRSGGKVRSIGSGR
jgi:hypothetical protein